MDKTTLGVIGAISSLVAFPAASAGATTAAAPPVPPAQSFSELLDPIPNALERLQLADAQEDHGGARLILLEATRWITKTATSADAAMKANTSSPL